MPLEPLNLRGLGLRAQDESCSPDDWSELLIVCYSNSELLSVHADHKMQTVILRGVHMSQQDLHGCSETLKIMQSSFGVDMLSAH